MRDPPTVTTRSAVKVLVPCVCRYRFSDRLSLVRQGQTCFTHSQSAEFRRQSFKRSIKDTSAVKLRSAEILFSTILRCGKYCYFFPWITSTLLMSSKLLATFGVLTDVQYADCEDRPAGYDQSKTRFYRQSLSHVETAFEHWKTYPRPVGFVLQLGDIIDGLNSALGGSHLALEKTLEKFECNYSIPTFHAVGNHELYNFDRKELSSLFHKSVIKTSIPHHVFASSPHSATSGQHDSPALYYKFSPNEHLKFISLDCFDISVLGYSSKHPHYIKAAKILEDYHKHTDFDMWDCSGELEGLDVRFQQMNGAVGEEQLLWLEKELAESDQKKQKVVVFGHVSLSPDSTDWSCLLWNYEEVVSCFHRHKCVVTYLSGHSHKTGYSVDSHGIHYVVFTGIVETPPESSAFATISLYSDRMEIAGNGREESYNLSFPHVIGCSLSTSVTSEIERVVSAQSISVKVEV